MTTKKPAIVTCPQCHAEVIWDSKISPYRPFCSERCKLIDLGQWASENYRVPVDEDPSKTPDDGGYQA
jgi:endogenous inhibitor of DNA gyrase (YacG/DUF329 family)